MPLLVFRNALPGENCPKETLAINMLCVSYIRGRFRMPCTNSEYANYINMIESREIAKMHTTSDLHLPWSRVTPIIATTTVIRRCPTHNAPF